MLGRNQYAGTGPNAGEESRAGFAGVVQATNEVAGHAGGALQIEVRRRVCKRGQAYARVGQNQHAAARTQHGFAAELVLVVTLGAQRRLPATGEPVGQDAQPPVIAVAEGRV